MKIIYIADPEILAIPIKECNEPFIDLQDQVELQYGPPPECELTAGCYTKMRATVFAKLCEAQKDLPEGWRFRLYEAFRSLEVQQMLFEQECEQVRARHPDKNYQEIFHEATRLASPVINLDGSENIPPHNTGGAVDVEIVAVEGELIDMGMEAKDWWSVQPELCMTHCDIISSEAKKNREILLEIMQAHEFVNYPTEWWHFSYGDRYWAYHRNVEKAIYGSADSLQN